jgi:hypothetical protein
MLNNAFYEESQYRKSATDYKEKTGTMFSFTLKLTHAIFQKNKIPTNRQSRHSAGNS